ncbi:MAG: hypothetical protein PF542_03400 [Nanoarchaeota archaeon]|jgi:hypothetical protein|nr:hypothetical protein [Nanoarchaeota archaeon]
MKKNIYIFTFVFLLLSMSFAVAATYEETFSDYSNIDSTSLQIESLKYEPYPVSPGEYFTLWILVKKTGNEVKDATFELNPQYPFSLDSNEEASRTFQGMLGESALLEYKVRVDKDAVEGSNPIELRYRLSSSSGWTSKEFDITIDEAQTMFDGVIQEVEGNSISLALANTGKNVANSVIVKVPQQDNFVATGASGQMVGNLDNGDYTIVSFDVKQIGRASDSVVTFQIDYTDNINERRTIYLELPLDLSSKAAMSAEGLPEGFARDGSGKGMTQQTSNNNLTWILVTAVVLLLLGFRKKIINLFKKKK